MPDRACVGALHACPARRAPAEVPRRTARARSTPQPARSRGLPARPTVADRVDRRDDSLATRRGAGRRVPRCPIASPREGSSRYGFTESMNARSRASQRPWDGRTALWDEPTGRAAPRPPRDAPSSPAGKLMVVCALAGPTARTLRTTSRSVAASIRRIGVACTWRMVDSRR